jgi:hypothetical protein
VTPAAKPHALGPLLKAVVLAGPPAKSGTPFLVGSGIETAADKGD